MGSSLNPVSDIVGAIAGPVLSLIDGNAQQKAADKNNANQQAAAVNNATQAAQAAQTMYNSYATAHPSPFAGANVARPQAGAYSTSPQQMGVIQRILAAAGGGQQQPTMNAPKPQQMPMAPQPGVVNAILGS